MKTAQMAKLYIAGLSSNQIAARAGVSGRTVLRRLHAAGVEIRPVCANRRHSLAELVREGTFRPSRGEERLEEEELGADEPELLRELQRLFRAATSGAERRALAVCFARIAGARLPRRIVAQ